MADVIGTQVPTYIPSLSENADIQAALRLYHYGEGFDHNSSGTLNSDSIAGYIQDLDDRVSVVEESGPGSIASTGSGGNTAGVPPTSIVDGFIWVDTNSSLGAQPGLVAAYQSSAPSSPVVGTLWVDSTDANTPVLKVYNGTTWKAV